VDGLTLYEATALGVARFERLPPRTYIVRVDDASETVEVTPGEPTEVALQPVIADPTVVRANLFPGLRGRGLAGELRLVDASGMAREPDSVDDGSGRATWSSVPEGTFTLTFDAPGFEPWSRADVHAGDRCGVYRAKVRFKGCSKGSAIRRAESTSYCAAPTRQRPETSRSGSRYSGPRNSAQARSVVSRA
jgi:hypothetical protein